MMSCRQASRTIASDDLASAGWRRRLAVRLHLLLCRHCRCYAGQLAAIGDATRNLQQDPGSLQDLEQTLLERCQGDCRKPDTPA